MSLARLHTRSRLSICEMGRGGQGGFCHFAEPREAGRATPNPIMPHLSTGRPGLKGEALKKVSLSAYAEGVLRLASGNSWHRHMRQAHDADDSLKATKAAKSPSLSSLGRLHPLSLCPPLLFGLAKQESASALVIYNRFLFFDQENCST